MSGAGVHVRFASGQLLACSDSFGAGRRIIRVYSEPALMAPATQLGMVKAVTTAPDFAGPFWLPGIMAIRLSGDRVQLLGLTWAIGHRSPLLARVAHDQLGDGASQSRPIRELEPKS